MESELLGHDPSVALKHYRSVDPVAVDRLYHALKREKAEDGEGSEILQELKGDALRAEVIKYLLKHHHNEVLSAMMQK